jgi:hypothetical protein
MNNDRSFHACSKIVRHGRDQIVVMGGWSTITNQFLSSIEFYDLTFQPTSWEIVPGISLPTAMGTIVGSVIMKLDDNLCDARIISKTTLKMHQCTGNYEWNTFDFSSIITKGVKKMAIADTNLF